MVDLSRIFHPSFDKPDVSRFLFYPRKEMVGPPEGSILRIQISVEDGVVLGGRFHAAGKENPTILFFHGNGEIAADYDDIGPLYNRMAINLLVVDYRGYGISTGKPSLTEMLRDAHQVLSYARTWLGQRGFRGPLVVMGRSLGSAPAIELAYRSGELIDGLIIESGFARIIPLLNLLGIDDPELKEDDGPLNLEKIRQIRKPTLIIHAQCDSLIHRAEGVDLYEASGAVQKFFLEIPGADHNDLFIREMKMYLETIGKYLETVKEGKR